MNVVQDIAFFYGVSIAKVGRPTKYDPKTSPQIAEKAAALGYTNEQIAKRLGIAKSTLQGWQEQFPDFLDSIKRAKSTVDDKVEQKLFKRAMGYSYTETVREIKDGELKIAKRLTKKLPSDVTAMIFWLKNRRPDTWRDRKELEISTKIDDLMEAMDEI